LAQHWAPLHQVALALALAQQRAPPRQVARPQALVWALVLHQVAQRQELSLLWVLALRWARM
jgi:hypothetical protein